MFLVLIGDFFFYEQYKILEVKARTIHWECPYTELHKGHCSKPSKCMEESKTTKFGGAKPFRCRPCFDVMFNGTHTNTHRCACDFHCTGNV